MKRSGESLRSKVVIGLPLAFEAGLLLLAAVVAVLSAGVALLTAPVPGPELIAVLAIPAKK